MAQAKIQDSAQPWMTLASTYEEDVNLPFPNTETLRTESLNAPLGQENFSNATETLNYEVDCARNAVEEPLSTAPSTNEVELTETLGIMIRYVFNNSGD